MSDRKWLNLVIFLISVMIILFLILQKNLDRRNEIITPQKFLLETDFSPVMLRINGRWLPVEQIQKEINTEQWAEFENAWKTYSPIAILNQQNESIDSISVYTLVWDDGTSKRNFKLMLTNEAIYLQSMRDTNFIFRFNNQQAKLLLPPWLINKTRIE